MRKKIFGLLLGATFMFTLVAGLLSTLNAEAQTTAPSYCRYNGEYEDCMPISGTVVCLFYDWPDCDDSGPPVIH